MSFWNDPGFTINAVRIGSAPNDGTGDTIRDSFDKIDHNFANVSNFLAAATGDGTVEFGKQTITNRLLSTGDTNITNLFVANATGTNATFSANVTTGNLIVNTKIYTPGIVASGNIVPSAAGQYDLGSVTNPFRNLYYISAVSGGVAQTTDAGMLVVHANAAVGDVKDVGIFGNITHHYTSNTYSFFGYQYQTNNFVYKITNTDASKGNSVVYNGIYGNAQLGSLFLSNSTISSSTSTGTLVVGGGAGIGGDTNIAGNISANNVSFSGVGVYGGNLYAAGSQVLTTAQVSTLGYPTYTGQGSLVLGNTVFASSSISTSPTTGAVVILGGLGVGSSTNGGNVNVNGNVAANGLVGPLFGLVQTAAQPNITSLGTLSTLQVNGSIGTIGITATGDVNLTKGGGTALNITANVVAGGYVGPLYGAVQTAAQPNITTLGTLTNLSIGGNLIIGDSNTSANTVTGIVTNSTVVLDTFAATAVRTAKYIVQIVDTATTPNKFESAEVLLAHDRNGASTLVYLNTFGVIYNNSILGTFDGVYNSGNILFRFTPNYTPGAMTIKITKTSLT